MKVVREQGQVLSEEYLEDRMRIVAKVPERIAARLQRYAVE